MFGHMHIALYLCIFFTESRCGHARGTRCFSLAGWRCVSNGAPFCFPQRAGAPACGPRVGAFSLRARSLQFKKYNLRTFHSRCDTIETHKVKSRTCHLHCRRRRATALRLHSWAHAHASPRTAATSHAAPSGAQFSLAASLASPAQTHSLAACLSACCGLALRSARLSPTRARAERGARARA